jgi:hypothetical protein
MPPYKPVVSTAQRGKLFALANEGTISMDEARGKARAAAGRKLPRYVNKRPKGQGAATGGATSPGARRKSAMRGKTRG